MRPRPSAFFAELGDPFERAWPSSARHTFELTTYSAPAACAGHTHLELDVADLLLEELDCHHALVFQALEAGRGRQVLVSLERLVQEHVERLEHCCCIAGAGLYEPTALVRFLPCKTTIFIISIVHMSEDHDYPLPMVPVAQWYCTQLEGIRMWVRSLQTFFCVFFFWF